MDPSIKFVIDETYDETVLAHADGTLNVEGTTELKTQYHRILGEEKNLILDMSRIRFVSSSGVGALIVANEDFRNIGRTLFLVNLSPVLENVLKLLELDDVLNLLPSQTEALDRLAA